MRIGGETCPKGKNGKMIKTILIKAFWLLVAFAGLYLVFLEIGMAISESHALRGTNLLFWAVFFALGFFLIFLGLTRLCRKPPQAN